MFIDLKIFKALKYSKAQIVELLVIRLVKKLFALDITEFVEATVDYKGSEWKFELRRITKNYEK